MLDAAVAAVGVLLLVIAATAVACTLRVRGRAAFVAAVMVVGAALIVLATIVLSLAGQLDRAALLAAGVAFAAVAIDGWRVTGRPPPPPGWRPRRGALRAAAVADPAVATLVAMAVAAIGLQLLMAVLVAPSNWDSMTYHLSRAAYWLQEGSATPFPGGSVRQLTSPPNGEILQAWTMAVGASDRYVALVQGVALVGIASCVHLGARLLGFAPRAALFAAALFAVLPMPILQAASTQNDLIAALFVLASAVFGVRALRDRHAGDLAIAALAAGLAVGTKGTVLALVPSVALILAVEAWRARTPRRFVLAGIGATVLAVVVLGAWGYALNVRDTGTLFGDLSGKTQRTSPAPANAVRVAWTLADSPGVATPWVNSVATRVAHATVGRLEIPNQFAFGVDTGVSEDTSAYGIVGWLAFIPLLLVFALRRGSVSRRAWAAAGLIAVIAFAVAFEWNIWVGRLLLPTVALGAPLFAALALRPVLTALTVAAAAVVLIPCLLVNPNKPLLVDAPQVSVLARDRIDQMSIVRGEMAPVIRAVDGRLGAGGSLAFVGGEDSWDYPFFGARRERRLVRFSGRAGVTPSALRRAGVNAVLFANVGRPGRVFRARKIGPDYWLATVS